jgi:hypothetical protein
MKMSLERIKDDRVRSSFGHYLIQRSILRDFFNNLSDDDYDFRMLENENRKADTPRESLAHTLHFQLINFSALKTGKLEYKSQGVDHYWKISRSELIAEMERIERLFFEFLTAEDFNENAIIITPWGEQWNCLDILSGLRDHDILHIGWNLALMDFLDMPRYASLANYWGEGDENSF